jgi:hypothetical protein
MGKARESADSEYARRVQVERALNEASAVFKKELWLKQEELQRVCGETLAVRERMARLTGLADGGTAMHKQGLARRDRNWSLNDRQTQNPLA